MSNYLIEILPPPNDPIRPDSLQVTPTDLVYWSNRTNQNVMLTFKTSTGSRAFMIGAGRQTGFHKFTKGVTYQCTQCAREHSISIKV